MLHLKIFLYILCFMSIAWCVLIFAGPIILKTSISSYSNNQIVASSITVTPKLDIKIGRLDYDFKSLDGKSTKKGFSRSVNILWSIFEDQPFLSVEIGPTLVKNSFFVDYLNFYTPNFSEINFKKILLNGQFDNLEVPSFLKSDSSYVEAVYSPKEGSLSEVSFEVPFAHFGGLGEWFLRDFRAKIDEIDLKRPIIGQNTEIFLSVNKIDNRQPIVNFSDLSGFLNITNGELNFQFDIKDFKIENTGYTAKDINVDGAFDQSGFLKNVQLEFPKNDVEAGLQDEQNLTLNVLKVKTGEYELKVRGKMEPMEILVGKNFIGNLPAGDFRIDSHLDTEASSFKAISSIVFKNKDFSNLIGNGEFNLELGNSFKILDCFKLGCRPSKIAIEYKFEADSEWLAITSICHSVPCSLSTASHHLKTSNTKKIFSLINKRKILSPLYSLYMYSIISSGEKFDLGNQIKIN